MIWDSMTLCKEIFSDIKWRLSHLWLTFLCQMWPKSPRHGRVLRLLQRCVWHKIQRMVVCAGVKISLIITLSMVNPSYASKWFMNQPMVSNSTAYSFVHYKLTDASITQCWVIRACEIFSIWVRSRNCGCLVTWFCYQLIAKPGNKTATVPWPDTYVLQSLPHRGKLNAYMHQRTGSS